MNLYTVKTWSFRAVLLGPQRNVDNTALIALSDEDLFPIWFHSSCCYYYCYLLIITTTEDNNVVTPRSRTTFLFADTPGYSCIQLFPFQPGFPIFPFTRHKTWGVFCKSTKAAEQTCSNRRVKPQPVVPSLQTRLVLITISRSDGRRSGFMQEALNPSSSSCFKYVSCTTNLNKY